MCGDPQAQARHQLLAEKRSEKFAMMGVDIIVASMPIMAQVVLALAAARDKDAFPNIDNALRDARFWPLQIVLLCVVISGHAAVDWIGAMRTSRDANRPSLSLFLLLTLVFFILSLMFAVSMLDTKIGYGWLAVTFILGLTDFILAYMLEMELAAI